MAEAETSRREEVAGSSMKSELCFFDAPFLPAFVTFLTVWFPKKLGSPGYQMDVSLHASFFAFDNNSIALTLVEIVTLILTW